MDRAISASDANQKFSELLREVARGESFVVMSRGRPVARVVPVEDGVSRAAALDALLAYFNAQPRRAPTPWRRDELYE